MRENPNLHTLIEGKTYKVMTDDKFTQKAIYNNGVFTNHITKIIIKNIVRVWL